MSIQLTPQQQRALDVQENSLPRVIDPRTNTAYILIPEADYGAIQELLEEEKRLQEIHAVALRNAAGRMNEHDLVGPPPAIVASRETLNATEQFDPPQR